MRNLVSLVLGGGRGTRLYPLTKQRSKPAVPLAGKYRLIDIPLSNCINSDITKISVLTQFNSASLHRHIRRSYDFDNFNDSYVEILAAQQTNENNNWYQGTADAVRKNLDAISGSGIDYVLILSGDQLYRMDFRDMLATHQKTKADVTIAGIPVDRETAKSMGIMRVEDSGRVAGFLEKPQTHKEMDIVRMAPEWIDARGIQSRGRDCLASMGIYLFNRDVLVNLLTKTDYHDFGREIFPAAVRTHNVQVHLFDGYWEDIGTIRSFFEANLALAAKERPFELVDEKAPIYTRPRYLAPTRLDDVTIRNSLVADGCIIGANTVIENSVIGVRCRIGKNVTVKNSILMGIDGYESPEEIAAAESRGLPAFGVGDDCYIDTAIIDKNARIGRGARVANDEKRETSPETAEGMIADGIVMIHKGAVLPAGWKMSV